MLRENLAHAESAVEALQVLMQRLGTGTVKTVLQDLGLPTKDAGDDRAKLTACLTAALTD